MDRPVEYSQSTFPPISAQLKFYFEDSPPYANGIFLRCVISDEGFSVSLPLFHGFLHNVFSIEKSDEHYLLKSEPNSTATGKVLTLEQVIQKITSICEALQKNKLQNFTLVYYDSTDDIATERGYVANSSEIAVSIPHNLYTSNLTDKSINTTTRIIMQRLMATRDRLKEYNLTQLDYFLNFLKAVAENPKFSQDFLFKPPLVLPPLQTSAAEKRVPSSSETGSNELGSPLQPSINEEQQPEAPPLPPTPPMLHAPPASDSHADVILQDLATDPSSHAKNNNQRKISNSPSSLGSIGLAVFFSFATLISAAAIALFALAMISSPLIPVNLLLLPLAVKVGLLITTSLLTLACVGLTAWFGYQAYKIDSANSSRGLAFDKNAVHGTYALLPSHETAVEQDSTLQADKDQNQSCGWLWQMCKTEECCADELVERSNSLEL